MSCIHGLVEGLVMSDCETAVIWRETDPPTIDGKRVLPSSMQNGLAGQVAKHIEDQGTANSSVRSHNLNLEATKSREPFGQGVREKLSSTGSFEPLV